jgi:glutathione S-transferase
MLRLYDYQPSGNGYKVRLLLTQLGIPYELVQLDVFKGASRTPEFLQKNPNGRIPCVRLENGTHLWESNAIQWYFAEGTPFLPSDRLERAQVLQWLCFEQYSHEPFIAVVRSWHLHDFIKDKTQQELDAKVAGGYAALSVMESHLQSRQFFVGERYSIADIALYAYTHVAEEGHFDLAKYPAVRAWLERVRKQPAHIPITKT